MNNCEKCGTPVAEEKAFCPNCGAAMIAERKRTPDASEEMMETIYEQPAPAKSLPASRPPAPPLKAPSNPVKVKIEAAVPPPASASPRRQASVQAFKPQKVAPKNASTDDSNRTLRLILSAAVVLFALSILVVVILYVTGKI